MSTYVKYELGRNENEEKFCCFRGNAVFWGYILTFLLPVVVGGLIFSTPWIAHAILNPSVQNQTDIQPASWFWNSTAGQFFCGCCVNCDSPTQLKSQRLPQGQTDRKPIEYYLFKNFLVTL